MNELPFTGPILLTGASGFVGHCALRRLLRDGREVHVLLRPSARTWRLASLPSVPRRHTVDLLDDNAVGKLLEAVRPQVVLHFAAYGAYEHQSDGRSAILTNVLGTYHLLKAAASVGVSLFINAGSSSEYGSCKEAMREDALIGPNSLYAVTKAAGTHLCSYLGRQERRMATVSFRLFSVYGPWEEPTRLIPTVLRRGHAGLPLKMVAPDIARDFIYVEDALDLMLSFEKLREIRGDIFNLGSGVQSTLQDVVVAVEQVLGRRLQVHWRSMAPRQWDTTCWRAEISKACTTFSWAPRHSLVQGLAAMAAWMKEVGDTYGPCGVECDKPGQSMS